nr:hypothetical protein [uncultured Carboxylicivirga sp.]
MDNFLHVISLTVPYPPNYGGAIDIYYKIKSLYENHVKIILHCFMYDRNEAEELEKYCEQVFYYERQTNLMKFFNYQPYIVASRQNKQLINKLNSDNYPILVEGIHGCSILDKVNPRRVFVRSHNIEHLYYRELCRSTNNVIKKIFYFSESIKLRQYEPVLAKAAGIFSISFLELEHFKAINPNTILLPPFHKNNNCISKEGKGNYILIHGNLSVEENIKSTLYFIKKIIPKINFQVIIAGMNPARILTESVKNLQNVQLIANPTEETMHNLIENAQIMLLHSYQDTGVKLKLINSIFQGRHCICNSTILSGTNLQNTCHIANNDIEWISTIKKLKSKMFSHEEKLLREKYLNNQFNNLLNSKIIIDQIIMNVNMF